MSLSPRQQRWALLAAVGPSLAFSMWLFIMAAVTLISASLKGDGTGMILGAIGLPLSVYLLYRASTVVWAPGSKRRGRDDGEAEGPTQTHGLMLMAAVWAGRSLEVPNRQEIEALADGVRRRGNWLLPLMPICAAYWVRLLWSALAEGRHVGLAAGGSAVFLALLASFYVVLQLRLRWWCRRYL